MKQLLLIACLLFSLTITSQNNEGLKQFINKNNVALYAVQKTIIAKNLNQSHTTFIDLLKKQVAVTHIYNTNSIQSQAIAEEVRLSCLKFLKEHAEGSTAYYEFTPKSEASKATVDIPSILAQKEIQMIESINVLDPQSLNALTLTIK